MEQLDINLVFTVILIMTVPMIYTFGLHKPLLLEGSSSIITRNLFTMLLILGIVYASFNNFSRLPSSISVALASPLYHTTLFRYFFKVFVKKIGREPVDVAFNFKSGLFYDRVFAMGFFFLSVFSSFIVVGILIWDTANK